MQSILFGSANPGEILFTIQLRVSKNRSQPMIDAVTRVLQEEAERTDAEGQWPERSIKAIAEAGLLGLTLPRDAGGKGTGMREFAEATEQIARHCASSAMIYLMHVCGAQAIAASSSPRRDDAVQKLVSRNAIATRATCPPRMDY